MRKWVSAAIVAMALIGAAPPAEPIIDVHMHSHAADRFGALGVPDPITGEPAPTTDEAQLAQAQAAMDRYNITHAFAFRARPSTMKWVAADPRFHGGAQLDSDLARSDLAQLREDIKAGRIRMIGEIGAQYMGLLPNDPSFQPYYDIAEEFDLPVGIHMGLANPNAPYTCCPKFRTAAGNPQHLEDLLVSRPKLRVYMQHAGYPFLADTIAVMHIHQRLYADVSAIVWALPADEFYNYLGALIRAGFGKRLMFGSDQMIWPDNIGRAVERIRNAPNLTPEQKRDILYNNAARFFRLDGQGKP